MNWTQRNGIQKGKGTVLIYVYPVQKASIPVMWQKEEINNVEDQLDGTITIY